jgi:hypothetical protein
VHKDELRFSGVINPSRTFSGSGKADYTLPENAPFLYPMSGDDAPHKTGTDKTALDAFKFRLAALMGQYFGRSVLLIALDDYHSNGILRESSIEALAALGKPSVAYLIDAFRFCSPAAEKGVGEALEKITGEKYGSDVKAWNKWLSQQEQKPLH